MFWLAILVFAATAAWLIVRIRRTVQERKRAEEERAASFLAGLAGAAAPAAAAPPATPIATPAAAPPADTVPRARSAAAVDPLVQQKLLFESAHKAGEAGEPALAIQLYARLLVRYPASGFADQARAGAEAQKKKLVKT